METNKRDSSSKSKSEKRYASIASPDYIVKQSTNTTSIKNRNMDDGIESPEINLHTHQFIIIYNKAVVTIQIGQGEETL